MPFISPNNKKWSRLLSTSLYDIYHLPGYSKLDAKTIQGSPIGWYSSLKSGEVALIPLIERVIQMNDNVEKDLVSPYGYPGLLCGESTSNKQHIEWIEEFHENSTTEGYVSSFLRLHPIYNKISYSNPPAITQFFHGQTVSINLNIPLNSLRKSYSKNHRRDLNHLIRNGFRTSINEWHQLPDFIKIYFETMKRNKAKHRYFFNDHYFKELRKLLKDKLILFMIQDKIGQQTAGGLFSLVNGLAQFLLGGTNDDFVKESPSKLMMDSAIEYFKEKGAHTIHLGGGFENDCSDGLFRFKEGFGNQYHTFSTLRFINRIDIYNKLLENNYLCLQQFGNYFPKYRLFED